MNPEMTPAQREAFRTWCWDATDADAAAFHGAMRSYLEPLERAIQATQSKPAPDLPSASDPGDEQQPEPTIPVPLALAREWVECESTFRRRWPDEHPRARLYDALKAALDRRDAK